MWVVNDMDRCQQVQDLLADYRTGILSPRRIAWIEEHLRQCMECANELRLLDGVLALVDANTPECEPPAGLWNGVYNRITCPEPKRLALLNGFGQWIAKPVRAAGVGIAALALAVTLVVSTGPRDVGTPVQVASNAEYVQGHALYAGQAPLADRVSFLTVVDASSESNENQAR